MPQYKLRPITVKATTVAKILADEALTPKGHSARIAGLIAGSYIVFQPSATISVVTPKGKTIGSEDDTLIENMIGELSLMQTIHFNNLYQQD